MAKLFFLFFILLTSYACAGQNSLNASFPAQQVSYSKITLVNESSTNICTGTTSGVLFVDNVSTDPGYGLLETCVNGSPVTSFQGCFNRFCSGIGCAASAPLPCPAGYVEPAGIPSSTFSPALGYSVTSIACCRSLCSPNCACAATTCTGSTCTDSTCGTVCNGTMTTGACVPSTICPFGCTLNSQCSGCLVGGQPADGQCCAGTCLTTNSYCCTQSVPADNWSCPIGQACNPYGIPSPACITIT